MQAIQTKYLPPTNSRGSRIKATCDRGSITIPYPHEVERAEVHPTAVRALIKQFVDEDLKQYGTPPEKNPWNTQFVSGGLPDGSEAHVFSRPFTNTTAIQAAAPDLLAALKDVIGWFNSTPFRALMTKQGYQADYHRIINQSNEAIAKAKDTR